MGPLSDLPAAIRGTLVAWERIRWSELQFAQLPVAMLLLALLVALPLLVLLVRSVGLTAAARRGWRFPPSCR